MGFALNLQMQYSQIIPTSESHDHITDDSGKDIESGMIADLRIDLLESEMDLDVRFPLFGPFRVQYCEPPAALARILSAADLKRQVSTFNEALDASLPLWFRRAPHLLNILMLASLGLLVYMLYTLASSPATGGIPWLVWPLAALCLLWLAVIGF